MKTVSTIDERLRKAQEEKRKEAEWVKASSVFQGGVTSNYRSSCSSSQERDERESRSPASFK